LAVPDRHSRTRGSDVAMHRALSELFQRLGEPERLARETAILARIDPGDPAHIIALGAQQLVEGRRDAAISTFRRIAAAGDVDAELTLAGVFADHDMPALAEQTYRSVLSRAPNEARALRGLAETLERGIDGEGAAERARRDSEATELWMRIALLTSAGGAAQREARARVVGILARRHDLPSHITPWRGSLHVTPTNL